MERIQELYVILDDKPGALGELCEVLAKNKINIDTIGVFGDSAKLLVQHIEKTRKLLEKNNYTAEIRDVIRVELENKPGELAYIVSRISHVGINVDYLFASMKPGEKLTTVILDVSNVDMALKLFE